MRAASAFLVGDIEPRGEIVYHPNSHYQNCGCIMGCGQGAAGGGRRDFVRRNRDMGDCRYCGKSAGFLRKEHKECAAAHAQGLDNIRDICVKAALHGVDVNLLPTRVRAIAASAYIDSSDAAVAESLAEGWGRAVAAAMEDHFLSNEEKRALNRYRARHNLNAGQLDQNGHFTLFRMMSLLNALSEHSLVPRFDRRATRLPFNLMKSEEMLWLFSPADYFEQVTQREFRGGSLGVSFRVARGVYIRPSAFRGRSVASTSIQHTD